MLGRKSNSLAIYYLLTDVSRHCVKNKNQEYGHNCNDQQCNDVLLVPFPNEEDECFHGVHKPVEGCFGTTGGGEKRGGSRKYVLDGEGKLRKESNAKI